MVLNIDALGTRMELGVLGQGHGALVRLTSAEGRVTAKASEVLRIVEAFYSDLYSEKRSERASRRELLGNLDAEISRDNARELEHPIDGKSVVRAIRKGKLGRSPGEDGIPHDWYKEMMVLRGDEDEEVLDSAIIRALMLVLRAVQMSDRLPGWFTRGVLTILYKKGDPAEIRNYRPLSIMGSDYRLYTSILTQRLVPLVEMVLGDHQTAFLPGRFIGDNVKLVQGIIDKYSEDEEGMGMLFLDQEKAYDRVSRTYLWDVLKRFGLPRCFIQSVKALYEGATVVPWINGMAGRPILVNSGVRQGDALSCILFDLVMEPLAIAIRKSALLRGIDLPNGDQVKCCLYADDTVGIVRNMAELEQIGRLLVLFEKASGQKINWHKTYLMVLGGLDLDLAAMAEQFRALKVLRAGESYTHLGIPVGYQIGDALTNFWDDMVVDLGERVASWLKLRLSQRSRLTIAKTLLVSVPVYALQHLEINKKNQERLEKLQQMLIWGGPRIRLSIEHSRLQKDHGGFGSYDLDAAKTAWAIAWVARMERRPDLPWVQLAVPLMRNSRSTGTQLDKVKTPWKQVLNVTRQNMVKAPSLRHIWEPWWKCLGYPGSFDPKATLNFRHPSTIEELLDTNFWYFPRLLEGGIHHNRGVAVWASPTWSRIANGDYGDINVIGDLLDVSRITPREDLGRNPAEKRQGRQAIETLIRGLPNEWRTPLSDAKDDGQNRVWISPKDRDPAKRPFQHCGVYTDYREERHGPTVDPVGKWIPLEDLYYKYLYKIVAHAKKKPQGTETESGGNPPRNVP